MALNRAPLHNGADSIRNLFSIYSLKLLHISVDAHNFLPTSKAQTITVELAGEK